MLTIDQLILALQQLDPSARSLPVCAVTKVREVESGPQEGALLLLNKQVVSIAVTPEALFMFVSEDDDGLRENHMFGLTCDFKTGNREIDQRLSGIEPGDEWKTGSE